MPNPKKPTSARCPCGGRIVWQKTGLAFPNGVVRLESGATLFTTYTSGIIVLLDARGEVAWQTEIAGATVYSPDVAQGRVHVADSNGRRVVVLDMQGRIVESIALPETFADISFVR